jgi:calmodulin
MSGRKKVTKVKVNLSEEQVTDFKEAFSLFDADGDGNVTPGELGSMLYALGMTPSKEELEALVNEADETGKGAIDFTEFINYMAVLMARFDKDRQLQAAFKAFDQEERGFFTSADLGRVVKSVGEKTTTEEVEQMVKQADTDRDGKITLEDFRVMTEPQHHSPEAN